MKRRHFLTAATLLGGCAKPPFALKGPTLPAVVFVPGNNEDACLFTTLIWRFETNGYPPALLPPLSPANPVARSSSGSDDATPAPNRSSTNEAADELHRFVEQVRRSSMPPSGARRKVVLCGAPNNGIVSS